MKIFFISDIHGSVYYLRKALECFNKENADKIVILGDELYHGARNPLPAEYNTVEATKLLNEYKDKIIAIRGNCDSEIDQAVLDYQMSSDYTVILYNDRQIFLTHGHIYNEDKMPKLNKGDIFASGHTHVPRLEVKNDILFFNPGSITFPKDNNPNSYGILEGDIIKIKDLDGNIFKEINIIV